jgi:hypothetical protein
MIEELLKELNHLSYKAQLEPENLLYQFREYQVRENFYKHLNQYRV